MNTDVEETRAVAKTDSPEPRGWMHSVIALLDPEVAHAAPGKRGGLLAWQARKVRAYIDSHITDPVSVAELGDLVRLSEAYFSRAFKRTFGKSPHAFVIRRRVELAAQYMLQTEAPLRDIALQCGFTDQPHLCKHFRQTTGHTPAAWRRVHSREDNGDPHHEASNFLRERVQLRRRDIPEAAAAGL